MDAKCKSIRQQFPAVISRSTLKTRCSKNASILEDFEPLCVVALVACLENGVCLVRPSFLVRTKKACANCWRD